MKTKGQINLEFLASAFVFFLVLGSMLTIASDSLPSFSEDLSLTSNRIEAYAISSQMISEPGTTSSGEKRWAETDSDVADVENFGLAKNGNVTHVLSKDKIDRLRSIDIGLSKEYINYSEFKSMTGAKQNYRFNFTWKPIFYTTSFFQKKPLYTEEPSLQAYYEMENESGNVIDNTGNGRKGSNNGAKRGVEGAYGSNGFEFENGEWIKLEDNFTIDSRVSFSLWFKNDQSWDSTGDYFILMGNDEGADEELSLGVENNNLKFKYYNGTDDYGILNADEPPLNEWVHLAGTYNESTGIWRLYQDGNQVEAAYDQVDIDLSTQDDNYINRGEGETQLQRGLEGRIDEVRIYNSTIEGNQVKELYSIKSKIRQPTESEYMLDSPRTYYGKKKIGNETHYYIISSLGSQNTVYVSDDWNMSKVDGKIQGESYEINDERYRIQGISTEQDSATMVISQHIKTFGSNVDSDSSVVRLSRYALMNKEPVKMEVLTW